MPVDKAWEEIKRLKIKCNTYAKRLVIEGFDDVSWEQSPFDLDAPNPYEGQKSLSPEVREVLSEIAGCDPDTWRDCWLYFNSKAKKLLEAGE